MKTALSIVFLLACLISPALAYNNQPESYELRGISRQHWPTYRERNYFRHVRHAHRHKHYRVAHHAGRHYAIHQPGRGHGASVAGQPHELVQKVQELIRYCGAHVVSGYRAGAHVAGTGRLSNHALNKADDMTGNYSCMYAHLRGWPGGYSTDSGRVHHIHISYNRQKEWGARFVHGGGYRHYARRNLRYARW